MVSSHLTEEVCVRMFWVCFVFYYYFLSENPLQYLNKDMQHVRGGGNRNPLQHTLQNVDEL